MEGYTNGVGVGADLWNVKPNPGSAEGLKLICLQVNSGGLCEEGEF